jgi:uncharacterized membrane protein YeaQ/YmgE (transglycosylase-associated protein family)
MSLVQIIIWIIIGGIAGLLAEWFVGGIHAGCIGTVIIGIIGALIGGWLFGLLRFSIGSGYIREIINAFVGAVLLLVLVRVVRRI